MKSTLVRSLACASKLALCVGMTAAFNGCVDEGPPRPLYPGRIYYGDPYYSDSYYGDRPYHRPLPPPGPGGPVIVRGGPPRPHGPGLRRGPGNPGPGRSGPRRGGQKPPPRQP